MTTGVLVRKLKRKLVTTGSTDTYYLGMNSDDELDLSDAATEDVLVD